MPHHLIKENLSILIEETFNGGPTYLAFNEKHTFSTFDNLKDIICGHVRYFVMLSMIFGQYIYMFWLGIVDNCRYYNGY